MMSKRKLHQIIDGLDTERQRCMAWLVLDAMCHDDALAEQLTQMAAQSQLDRAKAFASAAGEYVQRIIHRGERDD